MLLHDGVALPCVLEGATTSSKTGFPFRAGMEGEWAFRHVVPALESWLVLEAPAAAGLRTVRPRPTSRRPIARRRLVAPSSPSGCVAKAPRRCRRPPPAPPTCHTCSGPRSRIGGRSASTSRRPSPPASIWTLPCATASPSCSRTRHPPPSGRGEWPTSFTARSATSPTIRASSFHALRNAGRVFDTAYGADLDLTLLTAALDAGGGPGGCAGVRRPRPRRRRRRLTDARPLPAARPVGPRRRTRGALGGFRRALCAQAARHSSGAPCGASASTNGRECSCPRPEAPTLRTMRPSPSIYAGTAHSSAG